jgi:hypothetical protein
MRSDPRLMSRKVQLVYMAVVTGISVTTISVLVRVVYEHGNPIGFWGLQLALLALVLFLAAADDAQSWMLEKIGRKSVPQPTRLRKRLEKWRQRFGGTALALGIAANMAAIGFLIDSTGGSLHSPFSGLLAAPAIFGAYVAQRPSGLWQLLLISAVAIFVLDWRFPGSPQPSPDGPLPLWVAFAGAAVALLLAAGFIAGLQMLGDTDLPRVIVLHADHDEAALRDLIRTGVRDAVRIKREGNFTPDIGAMTLQHLIVDAALGVLPPYKDEPPADERPADQSPRSGA